MLRVADLGKIYGAAQHSYVALDGVNIDIADGEFFCLLGPVSYTHLTLPTILRV